MTHYSVQLDNEYSSYSVAKNISKNLNKNKSKRLSSKYSQNFFDHSKTSARDKLTTF